MSNNFDLIRETLSNNKNPESLTLPTEVLDALEDKFKKISSITDPNALSLKGFGVQGECFKRFKKEAKIELIDNLTSDRMNVVKGACIAAHVQQYKLLQTEDQRQAAEEQAREFLIGFSNSQYHDLQECGEVIDGFPDYQKVLAFTKAALVARHLGLPDYLTSYMRMGQLLDGSSKLTTRGASKKSSYPYYLVRENILKYLFATVPAVPAPGPAIDVMTTLHEIDIEFELMSSLLNFQTIKMMIMKVMATMMSMMPVVLALSQVMISL
jgi:hypothetical protein